MEEKEHRPGGKSLEYGAIGCSVGRGEGDGIGATAFGRCAEAQAGRVRHSNRASSFLPNICF